MNKIRISNGMFVAMIVNLLYVKSIGVTHGVLARAVGQDMWIADFLGMLQGLVMIYVTYLVIRRAPHLDLMSIGEKLLGKWFGKLLALVVFGFFLASSGPIMLTFVYHLQDYFLPEAPTILFVIAALFVGAVGCYYGLEVMARVALLGLLFVFLLNVLIIVGSTEEFDIRNLLPVLEKGLPRTAAASVNYDADCALAVMLAALILPYLKDPARNGGRLGMLGLLVSGIIAIVWGILESAVLSAEVTSQYTVACMRLSRNAHIGDFLQRYEMIMIALYSMSALFEIMFCIYGSSVCLTKLFGLANNRWMIAPCVVVIGVFSHWIVSDHFRALHFLENIWPNIAVPIAFGLPPLMYLLVLAMGKKLRRLKRAA